jgi:hypothetical protein
LSSARRTIASEPWDDRHPSLARRSSRVIYWRG